MATIPDSTSIERIIPSGEVPIARVSARPSGVEDIGKALTQIGSQLQQKKERFQQSKAETDFLTLKAQQDNAYHQDSEYGTFESRYSGEMEKGLGEIALSIDSSALRNEFVQRNKLRIAQGREKIKGLAFGKERDFERGEVETRLSQLRENALVGDVSENRQAVSDMLNDAVELGYFKAEEKGEVIRQWQESAALGRLKMMEPEDQIEALKQDWAKNLPSDTRAVILRKAKEATVAQKAIVNVDKYMTKDLDRFQAMDEAGKIKDPKERAETERRFDYAFGKQNLAMTEKRSEVFGSHYLDVRSGIKRVDDIPEDELALMSPQQQNSLFNAEANSVKTVTYSDRGVVDALHMYYQNKDYRNGREYFMANADKLNQADFNKWSQLTHKGEAPIEIKSLITTQQGVMAKLTDAEITDETAKNKILDDVDRWYIDYQERYNKAPDDKLVSEQVDRLLLEFDVDPGTAWNPLNWGGTKPIFEMTEEEKEDVIENIRRTDPDVFKELTDIYVKRKVDPTPEQFLQDYNRASK